MEIFKRILARHLIDPQFMLIDVSRYASNDQQTISYVNV